MAQRGNLGAELLTNALNPYFQFVIDILEKSGGDVVKFIGDAILVSWELKDSPVETLASAVNGCLKLLERLGSHRVQIPDEDTTFPLSMHIGLGVGSVYDLHVGATKHERWEYYLAGTAMEEVVTLVNVAQKRELALSREAMRILALEPSLSVTIGREEPDAVIVQSISSSSAEGTGVSKYILSMREVAHNPPAKPVYRQYINEAARLHISTPMRSSGLGNELRLVSVVFARFAGFDPHSRPGFALQQKALTAVLDVLRMFEGTLRQMVIDDKGMSILSVFGLPPLSHENDSMFGVRAALEIRKVLGVLFSEVSVAVTTGTVFTGTIGGRTRCDHTIMGEAVNLSARIMVSDECLNRVLCDKETFVACAGDVEYEDDGAPIDLMTKKGRSLVYKVAGVRRSEGPKLKSAMAAAAAAGGTATDDIALVGRESERDKALDALQEFLAHKTTPKVIIGGMGGSGKSALAKMIIGEATGAGVHVCNGKADEVDQSTPYFVYRDIVAALVDQILDATLDANEKEVMRRAGSSQELLTRNSMPPIKDGEAALAAGAAIGPAAAKDSPDPMAKRYTNTIRVLSKGGRSKTMSQSMRVAGPGAAERLLRQLEAEQSKRPQLRQQFETILSPDEKGDDKDEFEGLADRFKDDAAELFGRAILDRAATALQRVGMARNLAQMLAPIYGIRDDAGKRIANADRHDQLSGLIIKLINKVTCPPLPVPMNEGLLFAIDDGHWVDNMSWQLTWKIVRSCPRVMFVVTHRTASTASQAKTMTRLHSMPGSVQIVLPGLNRADVARLMCFRYNQATSGSAEAVVRAVSDKVLDIVLQKTGGNPLYVEYMFTALLNNKLLDVTPNLELILKPRTDFQAQLTELMPKDLQAAMLVQFDRLVPEVQLILRVASVIGQHFSLEAVAEVAGKSADDCYVELMTSSDALEFITIDADADESSKYSMSFRSAMLQSCVYSTMLFRQREKFHKHVASSYEAFLNDNTRHQLLLLIHFHYERTNDVTKRIHYMEAVAQHQLDHELITDALATLHNLQKLFQSLDADRQSQYSDFRQSVWLRMMGQAYSLRTQWSIARANLVEAMRLINFPFPSDNRSLMRSAVKTQLTKQIRYFSRRDRRTRHEQLSPEEEEQARHLHDVLLAVYETYLYHGDTGPMVLAALHRLNVCERLGEAACLRLGITFGAAEAIIGLMYYMRGYERMSEKYFERADLLAASADVHERMNVTLLRATAAYAKGHVTEARQAVDRCKAMVEGQANTRNAELTFMRVLLELLDGQFDRARNMCATLYERAIDSGQDAFGLVYASVSLFALIVCPPAGPVEGATDVHNWVRVIESSADSWPEKHSTPLRIIYCGALTCFHLMSVREGMKGGKGHVSCMCIS